MYKFFIFTADFDAWRAHRLFSAYRAFASALDPGSSARALYLDHQRIGLTFFFDKHEDHHRLMVFFTQLTGKVAAEHPYGDPVIQGGYDAATALNQG